MTATVKSSPTGLALFRPAGRRPEKWSPSDAEKWSPSDAEKWSPSDAEKWSPSDERRVSLGNLLSEEKRTSAPVPEAGPAHDLAAALSAAFDRDELEEMTAAVKEALNVSSAGEDAAPHPALEGIEAEPLTDVERVCATMSALMRRFALRRRQIAQSEDREAVAGRLSVAAGAIDERRARGELVAIRTGEGEWVYPAWQFDEEAPDCMLPGLPKVLPLLRELAPMQRVAWLTRPKPALGGRSPIDALRSGDIDDVGFLARRISAIRG